MAGRRPFNRERFEQVDTEPRLEPPHRFAETGRAAAGDRRDAEQGREITEVHRHCAAGA